MPVGRERAERQPEAHRVLDEQQLHVAAVDRNRFAAAERGVTSASAARSRSWSTGLSTGLSSDIAASDACEAWPGMVSAGTVSATCAEAISCAMTARTVASAAAALNRLYTPSSLTAVWTARPSIRKSASWLPTRVSVTSAVASRPSASGPQPKPMCLPAPAARGHLPTACHCRPRSRPLRRRWSACRRRRKNRRSSGASPK